MTGEGRSNRLGQLEEIKMRTGDREKSKHGR